MLSYNLCCSFFVNFFTVITHFAVFPFAFAVMVAFPTLFALTCPLELTVATYLLLDDQVTLELLPETVAFNFTFSPGYSDFVFIFTDILAVPFEDAAFTGLLPSGSLLFPRSNYPDNCYIPSLTLLLQSHRFHLCNNLLP